VAAKPQTSSSNLDCESDDSWLLPSSTSIVVALPLIAEQSIVMSVSVCLCVCLSVRDHISGTTRPIFVRFFVHVTCGRGSVLLWRCIDTLCTSGFMDDVIVAHRPRLLDVAALLQRGAYAALGLAISCPQ